MTFVARGDPNYIMFILLCTTPKNPQNGVKVVILFLEHLPLQYSKEGSFNSNVVIPLMKLSMYQSIEAHASQEKKLTPIVGAL